MRKIQRSELKNNRSLFLGCKICVEWECLTLSPQKIGAFGKNELWSDPFLNR